jgi:hypothetical protein
MERASIKSRGRQAPDHPSNDAAGDAWTEEPTAVEMYVSMADLVRSEPRQTT